MTVREESPTPRPQPVQYGWYDTVRFRLALPFILISAFVFALLWLAIGLGAERIYIDRLGQQLESEAKLVAYSITHLQGPQESPRAMALYIDEMADAGSVRMTLIASNGQVIADSDADIATMENHNQRPEVVAARATGAGTDQRDSTTVDETYLYVAITIPDESGRVLRLAVLTDTVDNAVDSLQRTVLIAVATSLFATTLAAWYISGRMSRPLRDLERHARTVAIGDYSARLPATSIREFDAVSNAMNVMSGHIRDQIDRQNRTSARLEAIMSGLVDGVVLTDEYGIVLRMNDAAQTMLDTDEETALGLPFVQASRDYELAGVLKRALDGKKRPTATVEHGLERASLLVTARLIQEPESLGLVVLRDVSEIRRLEMVRREFVANVSHELRTPLTSIRALVETLEAGAVDEPEIAMDFLGRIVSEIDRLNALVEDLLDFARLEAGRSPLRLELVNVGEVIRHGADRLGPQIERANLTMVYEIDDGLPEIEVDTGRIEQVLINLIHNAIKFTPAGGTLTLRAFRRKNTIRVQLQDTGIGIPEEELPRLFERFYKSDKARRSEGTGLGLAIVKNIVQLHGGRISVESEPGSGSVFEFTLPISRRKAHKRARRHAAGLA